MACTTGSAALLLQLTMNLVHNAIVHNRPNGGSVWVTTGSLQSSVVLTVENTGEALAPELVSMLVDPFQRGTERIHNDYAGVGLGLAIVKSITRAHDGRLTLNPPARRGAVGSGAATRCTARQRQLTIRASSRTATWV